MIDATVLVLTFTDQFGWGFSGKNGIFLNCSNDVDDTWYGPLCQVFKCVMRYDIYKGANKGGVCAANREIIEIAQTYVPRYVFYPCNFSSIVTEATLIELRKMGCIVVADFFDDDALFEPLCRWIVPYLDYVITHIRPLVAQYEKLEARCIFTHCIPLNSSILRRLQNQEKLYDATFIGSLYLYRRNYLADIAAHGATVSYLGGGNENKVHSSRMVRIFNQSRINLNFSSGQAGRSIIVGRVFEVTLCGGFLLTEYFPGLEQFFEIGREVVCFKTPQEASEKIQYYLNHSAEREQIAAHGYTRAQSDYTGPVVLSKVISEIEDDLRKRGRPELILSASGANTLRQTDAEQYYKWVRALLKSPPPLRNEWYATADLVLITDPMHKEAARLLKRAKKWGDPEPLIGRMRIVKYRVLSLASYYISKVKHVSFATLLRFMKGSSKKVK